MKDTFWCCDTIMSLSCHKTIWFSMPFIFATIEFGNNNLIDLFFTVMIATIKILGAIGAWWNFMPTTPHMFPKVHGIQLTRSRSSTFIPSFTIGYKQIINSTCQNFASVHHGTQKKLNEHKIYLFQNGAQNSVYLWFWRFQSTSKGYKDKIFGSLATSIYQHPIMVHHYAN